MLTLKNTAIRTTIAIFLTVASFSLQAKPVMTLICNEPNGTRTDFYAGEFKEDKDGFAGVSIKIVFDSKKAQQATVLYEPAKLAKEIGIKKPTSIFKVVTQNTDKVTIMGQPDTNNIHLYSLFPKLGIAYFTIHRYAQLRSVEASVGTLVGKCTVTGK
jgi:hypothetical protein